ncbi:MAG: GtrA family protein, partial [Prevotella sp.]|nr:GtrA family protein [Prevotella sp.]
KQKLGELVRFGVVGVIAVAIQYFIYLLLINVMEQVMLNMGDNVVATIANTIAYFISFVFNFIASTHYTFRVKASAKRGAGFAFSHVVNYALQTLILNLFVGIGVTKQVAMIPMFCITVPTNFILVRFFLKK